MEQRWASQLAAFDLEIRYKLGKANGNADTLSHQYVDATVEVIAPLTPFPVLLKRAIQERSCPDVQATQEAVTMLPARTKGDITLLQAADPVIGPFLGFWKRQRGPNREERERLHLHNY